MLLNNVTKQDISNATTDIIAQLRIYIKEREAGIFPDFPVIRVEPIPVDTEAYRYNSIKLALENYDLLKSKL